MKRKILLTMLTLWCGIITAYAQDPSIYVKEGLKAIPGSQITLNLCMKNNVNVLAWNFYLVLPEKVSVATEVANNGRVKYLATASRMDEHKLDVRPTASGDLMFSCYGEYPFVDNDGEILSIVLNVAEDAELGSIPIKLTKINYSLDGSVASYQDDYSISMNIYNLYTISAVSSDQTMGSVTLTNGGEAVENGTEVTAEANPVEGYSFVNWTCGETEVSKENPYKFTAEANTSLTANFKANMYDVTFDVDGKTTTTNMEFGSVIPTPESPVKTGYTFTGWSPTFTEGAKVPVGGITYTATWKINQYTVKFDTDGGSEVASITQDYASAVTAPANPTKTGYTFKGWDKEIPTTMPANDVTIKALWQINQYTITFDTDGGSEVAPITQDYASAVTAPANPTKTGYTFTGWDKEIPTTIPANNVTIKALWQINQYTITFDTDGGSVVAPIIQDYASAVTAPANPTKTGYTFTGWDKTIPATIPANNVTIKATWQINQYTVKFVDGETEIKSETLDYGSEIKTPANPTKTGYTFKGWSPEVAETVPAENVTYTAVWEVIKYTITFDTDGGSVVAPIIQEYASAVTAPANPTKTGYTFKGWDKAIPATMPANDVTIKATWEINQYTVKFVDDETEIKSETLDYGSEIKTPANPTKTGYTFKGWSPEVAEIVPAENVTYTAVWQINQYTITFNTDGGSEVASITQEYASAVTAPANPTKTGYTFKGWDKAIPATMPDNDVTIKATWQINQYTVKFVDGETEIKSETLDYGSEIKTPANPTKTGYTFKGWSPEVAETVPAENVTYTAAWQINKHTITFNTAGGSAIEPMTLDYGSTITLPAEPTREGYKFTGWAETVPTTMPDNDLTLTAQWQIQKYDVTFVVDNNVIKSESLEFGAEIVAPDVAEKEGYTFTGWSPELLQRVPSRAVTFAAQFKLNVYTLTYYINGEVAYTTQLEYGAAITEFTPEIGQGYVFNGWQETIPRTMPAHNVEIHGTTSVDTTGIAAVVSACGGCADVYNLQGRLVLRNADASSVSRLPRGLYIVNGVKCMKK